MAFSPFSPMTWPFVTATWHTLFMMFTIGAALCATLAGLSRWAYEAKDKADKKLQRAAPTGAEVADEVEARMADRWEGKIAPREYLKDYHDYMLFGIGYHSHVVRPYDTSAIEETCDVNWKSAGMDPAQDGSVLLRLPDLNSRDGAWSVQSAQLSMQKEIGAVSTWVSFGNSNVEIQGRILDITSQNVVFLIGFQHADPSVPAGLSADIGRGPAAALAFLEKVQSADAEGAWKALDAPVQREAGSKENFAAKLRGINEENGRLLSYEVQGGFVEINQDGIGYVTATIKTTYEKAVRREEFKFRVDPSGEYLTLWGETPIQPGSEGNLSSQP